jgi:hypothetical protein
MTDEHQENKIKTIEDQVHKWNLYAKYAPLVSLVAITVLWATNIVDINIVFYATLTLIAITSTIWWFWTLKTILYLLGTINNTAESFKWIQQEFELLKSEIEKIKK